MGMVGRVNNFDPTDVLVVIVIGLTSWNLRTTLALSSRLDKVETELRVRQETVIEPTISRLKRVEHKVFGWHNGH